MTLMQFRILLPQVILGVLAFWRLCVIKISHSSFEEWFDCLLGIVIAFTTCLLPVFAYVFLCTYSSSSFSPLLYLYVMVTTIFIWFIISKILPSCWLSSTTDFQRNLWDNAKYCATVIIIANCYQLIQDNKVRLDAVDKEIAEISQDNDLIRREIAEKEIIIERLERENAEQIASEKQRACKRLIKKKKRK